MADAGRSEPPGLALVYRADPGDTQVVVTDDTGSALPLTMAGAAVAWPPREGDLGAVAEAVIAHLTGIERPRAPLPGRLSTEVLRARLREGALEVEAREVRAWLAGIAPGLVHEELPGLSGASEPPTPPDTLDALLAQPGREARRGVAVARGIYANHPWHALWLPVTGEVLSVLHTDPSSTSWPVARLATNIPVADALHLSTDPPTSLGALLERLHELGSTGGPAATDEPASRAD